MDNTLTNELLQFVKRSDGRINSVKLTEACFVKNNKLHLWEYLHNTTSQFTIPLSLGDRVFLIESNNTKEKICKICQIKPCIIVHYDGPKKYSDYCSQRCSARERTNKNIGCQARDEYTSSIKRKNTMIEKYGVAYNSQRDEIHHIWEKPKTYLNRKAFEDKGIDYDNLLIPGTVEKLWKKYPSLQEMATFLGNVNTGNIYTLFKTVKFEPIFVKTSSSQERKITQILDFNNIEYITNTRKVITPQELDIYIPSKKIAIEVNGHFWHRSERIGTTYHINKMKKCESVGVTLLQFWDNDIDDKSDIVESIILNKLGATNKKFNARDFKIKFIDNYSSKQEKDKVKDFFIKNHIQGSSSFKTAAALILNDEILSCMTICNRRFISKSEDISHELSRYANKIGTSVRGAASKLFKALVDYSNVEKIVSYSDNYISNGNLYEKLNFTYSHTTAPAYFWVIDNQIIPRYRTRHDQLPGLLGEIYDPKLSEAENMESIGAYKIHNAGNRVWIWRKK